MDRKAVILTIIGRVGDCMLLIQYMDSHVLKKSMKIHTIIGYLLFFLINCILGILDIPFMIRTFTNIIMIICIGYICYEKTSIYTLVKEAIIFILLLGVSELLLIPIVFILTGKYDVQIFNDPNQSHLWLLSFGLSRLIAVLLFKVSKRIQKQNILELNRNELIILYFPLWISLAAFMAIARFVLNIDDFEKENISVLLSVIAITLIFYTVFHMVFFERYMRDRENEKEIRLLKQKNKLQYEYYKKQIDAFENIRILYHDLKNHMLFVQNNSEYCNEIDLKMKEFEYTIKDMGELKSNVANFASNDLPDGHSLLQTQGVLHPDSLLSFYGGTPIEWPVVTGTDKKIGFLRFSSGDRFEYVLNNCKELFTERTPCSQLAIQMDIYVMSDDKPEWSTGYLSWRLNKDQSALDGSMTANVAGWEKGAPMSFAEGWRTFTIPLSKFTATQTGAYSTLGGLIAQLKGSNLQTILTIVNYPLDGLHPATALSSFQFNVANIRLVPYNTPANTPIE